jgi:hypothetical protein
MGYYVRVLSTSADCVPLSALTAKLKDGKLNATLTGDTEAVQSWSRLILSHPNGQEIAMIERNLVQSGSLGSEELAEFASEIADCNPLTAVAWLLNYFCKVRCLYAFQVLSGTGYKNGWEILGAVKNRIWSFAPSILQADNEGFSNEDGYHILWQFKDSASGPWWMGVLRDDGWTHFQIDLGDRTQREAFLDGQIPIGAKGV